MTDNAPSRRFVQFVSHEGYLCGMCDDGTTWKLVMDRWQPLPLVPQSTLAEVQAVVDRMILPVRFSP